jgi:predicted small secreted protein
MHRFILLAALAATLAISACNTVAGAGRDVSSTGHAVTNTAEDAKPH